MDRSGLKQLWRAAAVDERVSLETVIELADEADALLARVAQKLDVKDVGDLLTVADEVDRLTDTLEEIKEKTEEKKREAKEALFNLLRDVYDVNVESLQQEVSSLRSRVQYLEKENERFRFAETESKKKKKR